MKHSPLSAARAIRALEEPNIAKTWADYDAQQHETSLIPPAQRPISGRWLNAYKATLLVMEQIGVRNWRKAAKAVERVIPELYAEYWTTLLPDWELQKI